MLPFNMNMILIKKEQAGQKTPQETEKENKRPWLRRLAPLVFFDYGRAVIKHPVPGEIGAQDLYSVGPGIVAEIGDNITAGAFYGFVLKEAGDNDDGDSRLNVNLVLRW